MNNDTTKELNYDDDVEESSDSDSCDWIESDSDSSDDEEESSDSSDSDSGDWLEDSPYGGSVREDASDYTGISDRGDTVSMLSPPEPWDDPWDEETESNSSED